MRYAIPVYLRFSIEQRDMDSGRGTGIFQAAAQLRNHGNLEPWELEELYDLRDWFNEHLDEPDRFTASKPPFYRKQSKAISWFRDSATEHITRVHQMIVILERHGIMVHTYRAERVGYIVYEDEFQVVAEPFSDVQC